VAPPQRDFPGPSRVLFLDELPEFGARVLEVMQQPMEEKVVTISRVQGTLTFPANFTLLAVMNPDPSGYFGDPVRECTCSLSTVSQWLRYVPEPLLDRLDLFVKVPRPEAHSPLDNRQGESPAEVKTRVEPARQKQQMRFVGMGVALQHRHGASRGPTVLPPGPSLDQHPSFC
jgi:magnesium chelatase family protein